MIYFNDVQNRFCESIRAFALAELSEGAQARAKMDHTPLEVLEKLAMAQILGMATPAEHGGNPRDCVSIGIAFEEVCGIDFSPFYVMLSNVVIPLMLRWASKDLKDEWLPLMVQGTKLPCFGNTEPDCGSDAGAIKTRAVRDGDCYVINGEKTSISGGMQADAILITTKTDPDAGARGMTCFLVPFGLPGVTRTRFKDMGGIPSGRASVTFSDVRVDKRYRVGGEGEGFSKVLQSLDIARVLCVLALTGMAEQSLSETSEYVKKRIAFGNPIGKFEGVSFKLAEAATLIEATKSLSYQALKLRDEGLPHGKEVAMAKWYGTTSVVRVLHDLLLVFGWQGYSETLPIQQRLRDAIGLKIGDGTGEIMKLIISRELLGSEYRPTI